jgi:hypothetical protein
MTKTYKILPGKPGRKRPFVEPRRVFEDSTKTDFREIACYEMGMRHFTTGWNPVVHNRRVTAWVVE